MNKNRTTTHAPDPIEIDNNLSVVDLTLENNELQQTIKLALSEAVQELYNDDDADPRTALWHVVNILGGEEATTMLEVDGEKAYEKYCG